MMRLSAVSTALLALTSVNARSLANTSFNPIDYIDPLIGSANQGHVFAGATLPFGMVKAVADSDSDSAGGFASDAENIIGFSQLHDSGTGGANSLGNFPIWPQPNCTDDDITSCKYSSDDRRTGYFNDSLVAKAGYFGLTLDNGVQAEVTVSNHTAIYRFTFDADVSLNSPVILVDVSDLEGGRVNGSASVDSSSGRLTAAGVFSPSFGDGSYSAYSCIDFQGAEVRNSGNFANEAVGAGNTSISIPDQQSLGSGGVWTQFKASQNNTILARVGMSFLSIDDACQNADSEIPNFDFDATRKAAEQAWKEKLSVIAIDPIGVSTERQTLFWSSLYRGFISPQDYTGQNPLWNSSEPYYDSFYCIWDSFRAAHPLLTLVDPLSQSYMIRSLVDTYRHEGYLPDCRMSFCKGYTQGGSNSDVLIVDAYLKGIPGIDWDTAYQAIVNDAENEPADFTVEGRGNLTQWKDLGYIPTHDPASPTPGNAALYTRSISRTVEYAYNDFCISVMANKTGKQDDYEKYTGRAKNWKNMFNSDQNSTVQGHDTGFTGFLQPKYENGTWAEQDPAFCSPISNPDSCFFGMANYETYEGSVWMYTFYAPHDMGDLITTLGGREAFTDRLSFLHFSNLVNIGDEQAFLPVYQFHYAGRPSLSTQRARAYIETSFNNTVSGIPGNDDSGAMGSFAVLTMLGIWPVPGQDVYLLNPPLFSEVSITNPLTGKTATIRNKNFDPSGYSSNIYIQSATRDGKAWSKNWITHDFFTEGGVLELTLGNSESKWGTGTDDLPPSLSDYDF